MPEKDMAGNAFALDPESIISGDPIKRSFLTKIEKIISKPDVKASELKAALETYLKIEDRSPTGEEIAPGGGRRKCDSHTYRTWRNTARSLLRAYRGWHPCGSLETPLCGRRCCAQNIAELQAAYRRFHGLQISLGRRR